MKLRVLYFLLGFMLFAVFAKGQDSTAAPEKPKTYLFTGYIKDLQSAAFVNTANQISTGNLIHNRFVFKYYAPLHITLDAELRNRLYYGEQVSANPLFATSYGGDQGYLNLSKTVINARSMVLYSQLDRLNLDWQNKGWEVTIGRQRINWGMAMAWNPNDVFNAYNLLDFDYEERPGNDAIRVQRFFSGSSSAEVAFKPGKTSDDIIANGLYKFNVLGYDFQFLSGLYNKDVNIGAGWAGNIKDAGFTGEVSYFHPKNRFKDTTGSVEVSISLAQSFNPGWFISFSALYNSRGQASVFNLYALTNTTLDASNLLPFRYSFLGSVQKTFSPITSGNFSVLYAPGINAVVFLPTLSYSISNNWNADLIGQSFFATLTANKFQTAGNAVYLRFRWSF